MQRELSVPSGKAILPRRLLHSAAVFGTVAALTLGAAACSSSSSTASNSTASNSGATTPAATGAAPTASAPASADAGPSAPAVADGLTASGIAAAKAVYAKYAATQPPITVTPLASKPKAGQTIDVMSCPIPVCLIATAATVKGAKALGWQTKVLTIQLTPESYVSTFSQVVADKPNYLAYLAVFPNSTVMSQLQALHAAGTKVAAIISPDPVGPLIQANIVSPAAVKYSEKLMADAVLNDMTKPGNTLMVTGQTTKATFVPGIGAYNAEIATACPGCKTTELDIDTAGIGRVIPGQVISALQKDPTISYVVSDSGDYLIGVPEALASAGLSSKVKIVLRAPNRQSIAAVRSGKVLAAVALENSTGGERQVDALARLGEGQSLGEDAEPLGWFQFLNKDNAPADSSLTSDGLPSVPGDPQAFLSAWHVG